MLKKEVNLLNYEKIKINFVQKNENLSVVLEKIHSNNCRTVVVLNKKIVGVISEGDIIKSLTYNKGLNIVERKIDEQVI